MADECLDELNERSTYLLTVSFFDDQGNPVTPDAATVRIDDEKTRTVIRAAEAIPSLSTSVEVEITDEENRIIKPRRDYEVRIVTIEFDYGVDRHGTAEYRYKLLNLYGVVDVASPSVSPSASASPS